MHAQVYKVKGSDIEVSLDSSLVHVAEQPPNTPPGSKDRQSLPLSERVCGAGSITHGDEKWEYQQRILHDRYQAQYKQARKRGSEEEEGIDHRPLGGCGRSAEAEADDQLGPVATYAGPSGS